MPKDIAHWYIAEKVLQMIKYKDLKMSIEKFKSLYYIGAVSFDIPYYYIGNNSKEVKAVSDNIHEGIDDSTRKALLNILNGCGEEVPEETAAFLCGIITHIAADSSFHPFIYYCTGNYNDEDEAKRQKAVCKHREFEAKLDLHFKRNQKLDNNFVVFNSYKNMKVSGDYLTELLGLEYFNERNAKVKTIKKALTIYIISQMLFLKRVLYLILKPFKNLFGFELSAFLSLFYPAESEVDFSYYTKKIEYRHPVTGELYCESISEITQNAVDKAAYLINSLGELKSKSGYIKSINNCNIPSLDTNLVGLTSKDMKYFKDT